MKLKPDEKYTKISIYTVLTLVAVYAMKYVVDFVVFVFKDLGTVYSSITGFFSSLTNLLLPLVVAFVLAYLFEPVADFIQVKYDIWKENHTDPDKEPKKKKKLISKNKKEEDLEVQKKKKEFRTRPVGALFCVLFIIVVFVLLIVFLAFSFMPKGSFEQQSFSDIFKILIVELQNLTSEFQGTYNNVKGFLEERGLYEYFGFLLDAVYGFCKTVVMSFVSILTSVGTFFVTLVMALILEYYLLKDKDEFKYKCALVVDTFLSDKSSRATKSFFRDVNNIFSGYIRGQLTDATIMAIMLSVVLSVIGIPYAIIISVISGFSNLIPYVGAIVGFCLAVVSGLLSGTPIIALYAAIGILIVQEIDTIYICPKVVGESVELSPFVVILALMVSGSLFGLFGMVVAVPVTAILRMLIVRFMERKNSEDNIEVFEEEL